MKLGLLSLFPLEGIEIEQGGLSSFGVSVLCVTNRDEIVICVMGVPLLWCACARQKEHVMGHHSNMYSVVLLGLLLCR